MATGGSPPGAGSGLAFQTKAEASLGRGAPLQLCRAASAASERRRELNSFKLTVCSATDLDMEDLGSCVDDRNCAGVWRL